MKKKILTVLSNYGYWALNRPMLKLEQAGYELVFTTEGEAAGDSASQLRRELP